MKEGWEYKKLGELALSMADGPFGSNLKKEHYTNRKEVRIIQLSNIGEEGWRDDNIKYTTFEHLETIKRSEVVSGDIVIAKMMPAGRAILCPNKESKYVLSSDAVRVTLKDGLNNRFILFSINSPYFRKQVYENVTGSGRVRTSLTKLKDCKIYLPSLSEQQSIVDYLDSAFANIDAMKANAEKALNEAKALFQASLKKMLEPKEGWEKKTLKETAKYRRGSFPQPYGNKEWYDGEGSIPFVQVAELQEDSFNLTPITKRFISKIAQPLSVFVPAGTVLVSLQGSIGKVAITDYDSYVDRTIAIFQDYKIKIDKTFFAYQLKIRFEIERLKARGTTIKTITKEEFANFIINCPPISEQQAIVENLESLKSKVDNLQENYDTISQECDALKQAILRQVFE